MPIIASNAAGAARNGFAVVGNAEVVAESSGAVGNACVVVGAAGWEFCVVSAIRVLKDYYTGIEAVTIRELKKLLYEY